MQRELMPLRGKYFCKIISDLKQTESGLFLADNVKETPHRAKVLAVGADQLKQKQSAKKGDIVHFKRVWNRDLPKDREMIIIKEEEIVGVE